jgi:hypothetical protein
MEFAKAAIRISIEDIPTNCPLPVAWCEKDYSDKFLGILDTQSSVSDNAGHGVRVYRICSWNNYDTFSICHRDVFPLPDSPESSLSNAFTAYGG